MAADSRLHTTQILPTNPKNIGRIRTSQHDGKALESWDIDWQHDSPDVENLRQAAEKVRTSDIPVAFPTETVYGLGADATRSSAVRGIFAAKGRPADNPLIVHVASLQQLRGLLISEANPSGEVPEIYAPLIERFWPGPLTILLPVPEQGAGVRLALEVTAGLKTFGVRIPRHILALALIKLADRPMAAPSANASTKPSPTTAEHVKDDLIGRIEMIIDGGPCDVGVESTVVDGLSCPPAVLRPGGISIEQIRRSAGWENAVVAYKDAALLTDNAPRAPGMKYRHYSPKAPVILFESGTSRPSIDDITTSYADNASIGIIRTMHWPSLQDVRDAQNSNSSLMKSHLPPKTQPDTQSSLSINQTLENLLSSVPPPTYLTPTVFSLPRPTPSLLSSEFKIIELSLGQTPESIARSLFAALRLLDQQGVDTILLEGIDDTQGELASAIMNRVRKAAETAVR